MAPRRRRSRLLIGTTAALLSSFSAGSNADASTASAHHRRVRQRRRRRLPQTHNRTHTTDNHHYKFDSNAALHPTYRRLVVNDNDCGENAQLFVLTFQTDAYGRETSWFLRLNPEDPEDADANSNNNHQANYIGWGPPSWTTYGDFTLYSFRYCLSIGRTYTLAMEDNFGDGMCCSRGFGGYEYSLGGVRLYSTYLKPTFRDYVEHTFTVEVTYTPGPTLSPTEEVTEEMVCDANPDECGCDDVDQDDYRGTISTTESWYTCQAWDSQVPHEHDYTPDEYPDDDLAGHNYCRSPGGGYTPWCYTTDPEKEWEYCRIPVCPMRPKRYTNAPTVDGQTRSPSGAPTPKPTAPPYETEWPTYSPVEWPTYSPSDSPTRPPTPAPTNKPTLKPTPDYTVFNPETGCYGGDVNVTIEARADKFSSDTSWDLLDPTGNRLLHQPEGSFDKNEYKKSQICVPHGNYTYIIKDKYGDGMCCRYGEGFFRVHLNDYEVLNGGSYNENITVNLNVGFYPDGHMTEREHQYLEAHNTRRKEWHERYNLDYVPLKYSPALARQSKAWAEELLHSCATVGIEHEDHVAYGENLAKNTGPADSWGQLYHPNLIVGRWVDREIGLPYPSNGHLTQALWRASKYLGCGESVKPFRRGVCRVQVCRYGRAGNCDMKRYNSTQGENWLEPMLDNYTRCGPDCPPEGCY
eukprot:CAMPEP_0183715234 /NCGR_PEP_ID=MMETSP0737-20130205/9549_1 /TAXON_ID=385413 /ORGANISM="Thalassiosira miniscula, Strain CCMP1093" /LENGTH=689 /DNA_ID=CAMNT_0025944323 /DNA_START=19 /DNA_END=2088 /DNA_ORIENTATION=+